jgi:hypothetical protein
MTLKELIQAEHQRKIAKSSMPAAYVPRPRLTDKTANGLTNCIITFFDLKGIKSWRQNSTGRYQREVRATNVIGQTITLQKGRYIPAAGGKGAGDITAVIKGIFTSIEVKIGKDRMRESQKEFKADLEKSGGVYLVVKTWDDFYFQISKYVCE